jgi:hypothetical protein
VNGQRVREQCIEDRLQRGILGLARPVDTVQPSAPSDRACLGCLELAADAQVGDASWHHLCALYWQGRSERLRGQRIPHTQSGPGITPVRSRWVIVVPVGRADTYAGLHRRFGRSPWVDIVMDRRQGDRRQLEGDVPLADRRIAQRRNAVKDDSTGEPLFRLAHQLEGCDVYEATMPVSGACPECGVLVNFDLPRFAEPPVRLELLVRHESTPAGARHYGELQSFSPTGRVLLSTRLLGRPAQDRPEAERSRDVPTKDPVRERSADQPSVAATSAPEFASPDTSGADGPAC